MLPLWFLVALATAVLAEDPNACLITGDPHFKPFRSSRKAVLFNYPCVYRVASVCLLDEEQNCKVTLGVWASNKDTNNRGNSFVSDIRFRVQVKTDDTILLGLFDLSAGDILNGNVHSLSDTFVIRGEKSASRPFPFEDETIEVVESVKKYACLDLVGDNKTFAFSFRDSSGNCLPPVLSFRPRTKGPGKPGLIFRLGQGVVVDPMIAYFNYLCNILDYSRNPAPLTQRQQLLYFLLDQNLYQPNPACRSAKDYFLGCEDDGTKTIAVRRCQRHTSGKQVACYKRHSRNAAEVLAHCIQYYCGNDGQRAQAKNWFDDLSRHIDCLHSLD